MTVKILDCTLRDGGYYNRWDFSPRLVLDYLTAMAENKIDFVELGLRQFKNDKYLGPHAYTTSKYLDRIDLPIGPTYGVMVDAKTVLEEKCDQEECIDKLFKSSNEEKIDLVRIAVHFHQVKLCLPMLRRLKEKGYLVGLNIMQSSLRNTEELENLSSLISGWDYIDVLYFADSLGTMGRKDVKRVYQALNKYWLGDIGFHSHNNLGKAIENINVAISLGSNWIDGTVSGMGRGAGNAETEFLLLDPNLRRVKIDSTGLFGLVHGHFDALKKLYAWGTSVPYFLGALNKLHPTYVQELCADQSLDRALIPKIISDLGDLPNPSSFDENVLRRIKSKMEPERQKIDGDDVPTFMEGKEVVLVAQTDLSIEYKDAIEDYCNAKKPILISINQPKVKLKLDYDFVVISHNEKFRDDENSYRTGAYSYVAPKSMFKKINIDIVHDYGILMSPNKFENCQSYACVPNRLTLAYAISFCLDAGVSNLKLVGFGGFNLEEKRHKEVQAFLQILATQSSIKLVSLTPTSFNIPEKSIYAI